MIHTIYIYMMMRTYDVLKTLSHSNLYLSLVFKELAEDGREEYRQRLAAWNALSSSQRQDPNETKTKAKSKKKKSSKKKRAATDSTNTSLPTGSRIVRHSFDSIEEAFQPTGHYNNTFTSETKVSPSESEADLQQQATSLQKNLSAVRLKLRVMELEASLAKQKEIESQLRDQINQQQQQGMQPLPYYPGMQETGILSVMSAANDLALEEQPHPSPNKNEVLRINKGNRKILDQLR